MELTTLHSTIVCVCDFAKCSILQNSVIPYTLFVCSFLPFSTAIYATLFGESERQQCGGFRHTAGKLGTCYTETRNHPFIKIALNPFNS